MDSSASLRVQRMIFPVQDVDDVRALYLEGAGVPTGRERCRLPAGATVGLCTYFNAFPAGYWQHWTNATSVQLTLTCDAQVSYRIWRSDADGAAAVAAEGQAAQVTHELPLTGFDDGGLYWLELTAGEAETEVISASWSVSTTATAGTASIGITTFNRPSYCLDQLRRISAEPALLDVIDQVFVVDQGSDLVSDQPGFGAVAALLGDKLCLIRQANLGGSGGFSRAMLETIDAGRSRYVLLLDDDAISEPEAILRAIRFADVAAERGTVLVGGGMLRLDRREVLFVQGEAIDLDLGRPTPLPGLGYNHDFASAALGNSAELHRRHDAGYNAWWMCLIPTGVIAELGLSLPFFIKWDDMEFGLRAARAGYPTVSLPGVAVWHQAWDDKFSWRSWEEYFSERNRWLALMAHQPGAGSVPLRSFLVDVGMILSLQYSSAALRIQARQDALRGLAALPAELPTRLGEVRQLRGTFDDADKRAQATDFPPATGSFDGLIEDELELHGLGDVLAAARVGLRQLLMPVRGSALTAPQVELTGREAIWRQFRRVDSALVAYPDGYTWLRRNQALTWRLLWRSATSVVRPAFGWARRHHQLRHELPLAASPREWRTTFDA